MLWRFPASSRALSAASSRPILNTRTGGSPCWPRAPAPTPLQQFVRGAGPLYARAVGISEILRAAALTDPDVHAIWRHHDQKQVAAFRRVIDAVITKGPLRSGLDPAAATDILLTVYGDTSYLLLTTERGWTHDQVIDWACQALPALLLQPGSGHETGHDRVHS